MPSRLNVFLAELRRRKVTRAAVAYLVIGFAVLEGADNLRDPLGIPDGLMRFLAFAVLTGFPILLALAWAFDITSEGIEKTKDLPNDPKISPWERAALLRQAGILGPLAVVVLAIATSVLVWSVLKPIQASAPALPGTYVDSVAVMPLANLTGDPAYDFLSVAMAEEIINELTQIRELKVTSRHSVEVLSRQSFTIPELADTLKVQHMVEGSIHLLDSSTVRATVQHIVAETDAHLWSREFDWQVDDLAGLYERVASEVTRLVVDVIPGLSMPTELGGIRGDPELEAYRIGKHLLGRRTPEGLRGAIGQFLLALMEDPEHALALADLSSAYGLALNYRYEIDEDEYTMAARALSAAEEAIRLAPEMAGGYASRGYLKAIIHAPVSEVRADFARAESLQPNAASVPSWSARVLAMDGRDSEAISEARRAVDLDPVAAGRHIAVASLSLQLGRFEDAIRAGETATELEPELQMGRALVARARLLNGEAEGCATLRLGPHSVLAATCLHELGQVSRAQAAVDSVTAALESGVQPDPAFSSVLWMEDLAVYHAWLGDAEGTLEWMRRAFEASPAGIDVRLYESGLFDRVRTNPGFTEAADRLFDGRYQRVWSESRGIVFP